MAEETGPGGDAREASASSGVDKDERKRGDMARLLDFAGERK